MGHPQEECWALKSPRTMVGEGSCCKIFSVSSARKADGRDGERYRLTIVHSMGEEIFAAIAGMLEDRLICLEGMCF